MTMRIFDAHTTLQFSPMVIRCMILVTFLINLESCQQGKSAEKLSFNSTLESQAIVVDAIVLKRSVFKHEIISNGKLAAVRKSDVRFRVNGQIQKLHVHNGEAVVAGQVIAELDATEFKHQLAKARIELKKSEVELNDLTLAYKGLKDLVIPDDIKETLLNKSGYANSQIELEKADYEYASTLLKAPFSGMVANLKSREHEQVSSSDLFCMVVDHSAFEVEFYLLESELLSVNIDDPIRVFPVSSEKEFRGHIIEINPIVDENGLVLVKGILNSARTLWDGMNVKVYIDIPVPDQLNVPKTSIVSRQNQQVLFKYVDGRATWTYVQVLFENSSFCAVIASPGKSGSLQAGDTIITEGNLTLADQSLVQLRADH
ncbi:MAG: efflux RND transporter periplasmic adaptor subunit [Chryseolinea sp.]